MVRKIELLDLEFTCEEKDKKLNKKDNFQMLLSAIKKTGKGSGQ